MEKQFNFNSIINAVKENYIVFILSSLSLIMISVLFVFSLDNEYTSKATLRPVVEEKNNGIGSKIGGIAAIAGIDIPSNNGGNSALALERIMSRDFSLNFIKKNKIENLFFEEDDDKRYINDIIYNKYLSKISINKDKNTGFVKISFTTEDPEKAKYILSNIISDINYELREKDLNGLEKSIKFLDGQISENKDSNLKKVLYALLEEKYKSIIFAKQNENYVFEFIDIPNVPEIKSKPNRILLVISLSVISLIVSFSLAYLIAFKNDKKNN